MRKLTVLLLLLALLTACNLPRGIPGFSLDPGADPEPAAPPTETPTPTVEVSYTECGWAWATQSLPDLSAEIQSAMEAAGLTGVTARAEAYGENCVTADGVVDHFATMETDFRIRVEVADLNDTATLGDLAERILIVLDTYPPGIAPGPNAGYIGITYVNGETELNLWFTVYDGESARALGLHGADLYNELYNR